MKQLLLAQLRGLATQTIMQFVVELVKLLVGRADSSINKDGEEIINLIKKNSKEDKKAGFNKSRAYTNNQRK